MQWFPSCTLLQPGLLIYIYTNNYALNYYWIPVYCIISLLKQKKNWKMCKTIVQYCGSQSVVYKTLVLHEATSTIAQKKNQKFAKEKSIQCKVIFVWDYNQKMWIIKMFSYLYGINVILDIYPHFFTWTYFWEIYVQFFRIHIYIIT